MLGGGGEASLPGTKMNVGWGASLPADPRGGGGGGGGGGLGIGSGAAAAAVSGGRSVAAGGRQRGKEWKRGGKTGLPHRWKSSRFSGASGGGTVDGDGT